MFDTLSLPFIQRALIAGLIVGSLASYLGAFVVQRRLSFLGDGLAHAAFAGFALGLLLNGQPLLIALPFAVAVALGVTWVREKSNLGDDTAIGIFFAFSVALGVLLMSLRQGYTADLSAYMFGSILAVSPADLWASALVALVVLALLPMWSRWAYATFDRELALADHQPVLRDDYLLSALIAVVTVTSVKLVGIVLIAAFLVIPAAAARLLSPTFARMTLNAVWIGVASVLVGMIVSYAFDLPSGATIVLCQVAMFGVALMLHPRQP